MQCKDMINIRIFKTQNEIILSNIRIKLLKKILQILLVDIDFIRTFAMT